MTQRASSSKPQPKRIRSASASNSKATASQQRPIRRIHKTRSSLIDYHPLRATSSVRQTDKTSSDDMQSSQASTPAIPVPPYLPPARKPRISKVAPKTRVSKKTIISSLAAFTAIVLLASGFLIPILENPSVTIIIYVIAAIIFRLSSRVSFSIALLLLLAIPVLLLIRNTALASTYAVFCFYFLVVGVISATIELHKSDN